MARKYYTVIEFTDGQWEQTFGDYSKDVADQERIDQHESGHHALLKNLKVITSGDKLADINAAIAKLNAKVTS